MKDRVAAILSCRDPTARLAKHQAEWTEGSLEATCTTTQWKNVAQGVVPYSGDKLKGQNGFGAGTVYTYACDYDTRVTPSPPSVCSRGSCPHLKTEVTHDE